MEEQKKDFFLCPRSRLTIKFSETVILIITISLLASPLPICLSISTCFLPQPQTVSSLRQGLTELCTGIVSDWGVWAVELLQ